MIRSQPGDHTLPELVRNVDGFVKFVVRNISGGIVASGISFFREDSHLLNKARLSLYGEFQRFNCFQVVTHLHGGAIARRAQGYIRCCTGSIEGSFKAAVLGDRLDLGIVQVAMDDAEQVRDLSGTGRLSFEPTVFSLLFQAH